MGSIAAGKQADLMIVKGNPARPVRFCSSFFFA